MLSGEVLSQWMQRRVGTVVAGSRVQVSQSGLLRVSTTADSRRLQLALPVMHGGQAAVARAVVEGSTGPFLALRAQAVSGEQEQARQMERLVAMLTVAEAARANPALYPAVLPVLESFVLNVPMGEVNLTTRPLADMELWCDVMAWCPQSLDGYHREVGAAARAPGAVMAAFAPVLATVRAVHDNLNIVHRDITPANVLVDGSARLLLADWGIAHTVAADRTSTHTQMIGNRGFCLPPEMLAGDTAIGRYTDAWYLGSLLVWMLTGRPPGPGGELPVLPGGADGARLAALAQGLCWPDPRHRLGLPQAVDQLAGRGPVWRAPVSAPVPGPAPAYVPGTTPVAVRPAPAAPPAPRRWSRVFVALGALAVVVLAVVGVVWQGSRDGPSGAGTGPASDPATRPAPNPTYTFEPDAAAYPPFEGLNAAVTAFPLLSDDLPQCRRVAPAQYVPAGAREVFACVWDDLDATVYLSRWATGFAGAEAWRDTVGPDALERSWGTASTGPDHERGPRFAWGENPSHRVICYRDLPYCMEIVSAVQDITDEVYDRIGGLDTDDAAGFVARWPDVDPDFALPEPS